MAEKKAYEVERWLARPDPAIAVVLLYGTDRGLVSERARRFAENSGVPLDDPFSVVRLDAGSSDLDAGRIVGEARMVSMFSPRRLLWVRNGGNARPLVDDLTELCGRPPADAVILVEAGELKKKTPLRALIEDSPNAVALPCYADEEKAVDLLIDEEMHRSHLRIAPDARAALRDQLGGDRLASRGEIEKLALFAAGSVEITLADVRSVTGDVSAVSSDEMIERVVTGDRSGFARLFAAHVTAATQVQPLLAAALRQFQQLHGLRAGMDANRGSAASTVSGVRPPVYGSRKAMLESGLSRWSTSSLEAALTRIQKAVLESRRRPDLAVATAERVLLSLSGKA